MLPFKNNLSKDLSVAGKLLSNKHVVLESDNRNGKSNFFQREWIKRELTKRKKICKAECKIYSNGNKACLISINLCDWFVLQKAK